MTPLQFQIAQKCQLERPFFATRALAEATPTPFDAFPYKYWYRGQYDKPYPVVIDRTAGYRPRNDGCYKEWNVLSTCTTPYCWQYPCSTVHPCRPNQQIARKQTDQGIEVCEGRCNVSANSVVSLP